MADVPVPNLIIAGVPKAGTTSLYWYLSQHPGICASDIKEVNYYTPARISAAELPPFEEYLKHFSHCAKTPYIMEASPSYSFSGAPVIRAIKETLDAPRIILILREPVSRFWSEYNFHKARGLLPGVNDCDEFITACEEARREGTDRILRNRLVALSIGFYSEWLGGWLEQFGNDVRVVFFDDLSQDVHGLMMSICGWLGLDTHPVASLASEVRNRTVKPRSLRLHRFATSTDSLADSVLRRRPVIHSAVRSLYFRLNTTPVREPLGDDTRKRLEQLYHPSTMETAKQLRAHHYERLPGWLDTSSDHQGQASG